MNKEEGKHEIVIIRRGGHGHEEGHHGGMWKIAYADFMTAMMALFLVLWLVNSTDEKTLAQIATYFNPIDLSDKTTTERGVQDKNQGGTGTKGDSQPAQSGNSKSDTPRNSLERAGPSEDELFSDPYDILAKIASKASRLPTREGPGGQQATGGREAEGDTFRDPFDPEFHVNTQTNEAELRDLAMRAAGQGAPGTDKGEHPSDKAAAPQQPLSDTLAAEADKAAQLAKQAEQELNESAEVAQLRRQVLRDVANSGLANLPDVTVQQTGEGILISLTDQSNFEMFALSSAEPRPELVVLMEQLAGILANQPGKLVVRGHTDARPFRSKTYDNWRLSTARAHMAHYMLLRGGVPKERVERIEGYADRTLKLPDAPTAAQNRRIEILIKPEAT